MRSYRGVRGGTPTGEPLCKTCKYASYRFGARQGEALLICGATEPSTVMPFEVYDCSDYGDVRLPQLYHMQERAWLLVELTKGGKKWMPSQEYNELVQQGKVKRLAMLRGVED